jgi:hypothetical protein
MSRRENAAEGARGADASNTCADCTTGIDTSAIDFGIGDEWGNKKHYNKQGNLLAVDIETSTAPDGNSGRRCGDCGDNHMDSQVHQDWRDADNYYRRERQGY